MVDWMIEVLSIFGLRQDTYFLAVYLMDKFLSDTPEILENDQLHLIGVCAMFIASKHEEIRPLFMQQVEKKIGHNSFKSIDIRIRELDIVQVMKWRITLVTPLHFIEYIDTHLKMKYKNRAMSIVLEELKIQVDQMCKLAMIHSEMLKFKPSEIAAAAYALAIETMSQDSLKAASLIRVQGHVSLLILIPQLKDEIINVYFGSNTIERASKQLQKVKMTHAQIYPDFKNIFIFSEVPEESL